MDNNYKNDETTASKAVWHKPQLKVLAMHETSGKLNNTPTEFDPDATPTSAPS